MLLELFAERLDRARVPTGGRRSPRVPCRRRSSVARSRTTCGSSTTSPTPACPRPRCCGSGSTAPPRRCSGIAEVLASSGRVVLGADTLVVNPDATDRIVVFGTEEDLAVVPALDSLRLADETDLEPGATTAIEVGDTDALLDGDLLALQPGRWLVVVGVDPEDPERLDPDVPAHVVRVTRVEVGTDTTRVLWDPRRPAPFRYDRSTCRVLGNVVPAHHGIPLTPVTAGDAEDTIAVLEQERPARAVAREADGRRRRRPGCARSPCRGPGQRPRLGLAVPGATPLGPARSRSGSRVDGEPWARVEDLVLLEPGQDGFALRTGPGDTPVARFAESALPARTITVDLAVRVGLGTIGNVGVGAMTRLLALGPGGDREALLGDGGEDRLELLRRLPDGDQPGHRRRRSRARGHRDACATARRWACATRSPRWCPRTTSGSSPSCPRSPPRGRVVRDGPLAPVVSSDRAAARRGRPRGRGRAGRGRAAAALGGGPRRVSRRCGCSASTSSWCRPVRPARPRRRRRRRRLGARHR